MLHIVVPMAGSGSRFTRAGYARAKPLIPILGVPMIRLVIANLTPKCTHRFIFVCQRAHVRDFDLIPALARWAPGSAVVQLDGLTEGAACTVLTAKALIDNDQPLMIANSDQYIDASIDAYLQSISERNLDGMIMTMQADDPKWSFAELDPNGFVTRVAEKEVISSHATVGVYNFRRGADFVRGAEKMVAKDLRVNNEFYVAPVYNQLTALGARIGVYDIGTVGRGMYGLGIPSDLEEFQALPLAAAVTAPLR
jgi:dTDP-glucose pyrophosphorylase